MVNMRSWRLNHKRGRLRRPRQLRARHRPAIDGSFGDRMGPAATFVPEGVVAECEEASGEGESGNLGSPAIVVKDARKKSAVSGVSWRYGCRLDQCPAQYPRSLLGDVTPTSVPGAGALRWGQSRPGAQVL